MPECLSRQALVPCVTRLPWSFASIGLPRPWPLLSWSFGSSVSGRCIRPAPENSDREPYRHGRPQRTSGIVTRHRDQASKRPLEAPRPVPRGWWPVAKGRHLQGPSRAATFEFRRRARPMGGGGGSHVLLAQPSILVGA